MRLEIRYHSTDHDGTTRAQRNAMVGVPVPEIRVPPEGLDIWAKFWDLRRFKEAETRITPREIVDYRDLYETEIDQAEIRILCDMDKQFAAIRAEEMAFNEERRGGANG